MGKKTICSLKFPFTKSQLPFILEDLIIFMRSECSSPAGTASTELWQITSRAFVLIWLLRLMHPDFSAETWWSWGSSVCKGNKNPPPTLKETETQHCLQIPSQCLILLNRMRIWPLIEVRKLRKTSKLSLECRGDNDLSGFNLDMLLTKETQIFSSTMEKIGNMPSDS